MAVKTTKVTKTAKEQAYARGRAAGQAAAKSSYWFDMAESCMQWARRSYPASADLNYRDELVKLEKERLAAKLDLSKFPECRGLADLVRAEHKGFLEGCNVPWVMAYQFNWYWFISRRLNTRYVGKAAPQGHCTGVWFRDSKEGPLCGSNLDDIRRPFQKFEPPKEGPSGKPFKGITCVGGVSSAVLCDEEPENIFPVDPFAVMPPEIKRLPEFVSYCERYREFFGPCNMIWVDAELNSVAFEKANVRLGVRWERNGASAVTACSYITPEMNRFKKECDQKSYKARGWTEDCPDFVYWAGAERRYHRLLELVDQEARRGPTLWGLATILLDHAVPFPDRICLAGEKGHRNESDWNWTLSSQSNVLFGPTRRTLWWRVEGTTPIHQTKPFLVLGKGVAMQPDWKKGTGLEG